MILNFYKYQGTGNDFILIDNRSRFLDKNNMTTLVAKLCHRRFGIGADGLMLLENHHSLAFEMIYYNADGSTSTMCGNGGRCIVAFAEFLNIINKGQLISFFAVDSIYKAIIKEGNNVALAMRDLDVNEIEKFNDSFILNTGSPHYVTFINDLKNCDIMQEGKKIRYSEQFYEKGINVNFVERNQNFNPKQLQIATYERGVEAPTYSCGTGATAVALVQNYFYNTESPIQIKTDGGLLTIAFEKDDKTYKNIWLEGAANYVFSGKIEI